MELENQNTTEAKENTQPANQAAEQGAEARPAEGTSTRRRRKPSSSRSGKSRDGQAKTAQAGDGQAEGKKAQAGDGQAEGKKTQAARKEPAKKDAAKKEPAKKEAAKKDAGKNQNQNRPARVKSAPKGDGKGKLKIIPLGGLEQIGMNITAFEYEDTIIVVDCGLAFPGDDMLGIDLVIPDVTYLKNNIDKVKGFVITHGHEDHIGALPYILEQINVPVYGTKLTMALIEHKLKERGMMRNTKRKVVKHGQSVNLGCFREIPSTCSALRSWVRRACWR